MNYNNFYFIFGNIYNNSFHTFLMIFFAFMGYAEKSASIAIAISCTLLLTQIFSGNMRNIIIASHDMVLLNKVKKFRLIFSNIVILTSSLIFFVITKEINLFILAIIFSMIISWINEINIVEEELKKNTKKITIFLIINFIFSIAILYYIYIKVVEIIFLILIVQTILNIFLFFKKKDLFFEKKNFYLDHFNQIKKYSYAFYSSFSMIFANFISRSLIFLSLDKKIAGILFAAFAIGSLPGTVFNNTFGPFLIKKKIIIPKFLKIILITIFFTLLSLLYFIYKSNINFLNHNELLYFTSLISLIGSFFMVYSLYLRQFSLQNYFDNQKYIFSYDIFLNSILILLTIIIIILKIDILYYFLLLIFSIISLLVYKFLILKLK